MELDVYLSLKTFYEALREVPRHDIIFYPFSLDTLLGFEVSTIKCINTLKPSLGYQWQYSKR